LGAIGLAIKTQAITQTELIPAAPSQVFKALTDPQLHTAFTGAKATGEPKVGGQFTAWDNYISGKYLDLQEGKRILQEWRTSTWPEGYPPSILEFKFKQKGKNTEVTMVHSQVPSEQAEDYAKGWVTHYWKPLKAFFGKK